MDIDDLLTFGSQVQGNKSPLERKREKKQQSSSQRDVVLQKVTEIGVPATAALLHISESAVAKVCVPLIRKGELSLPDVYEGLNISEIEAYLYSVNTSSMKRLVQGSEYGEAALRLVKAHVEGKLRERYDEE